MSSLRGLRKHSSSSLPLQHRNGVLLGYQIHVKHGNGSAFHSNVTLNATATRFLLASNLSLNEEYRYENDG